MSSETLLNVALQSGILFLALWAIFRLTPSLPADAKAWIWRIAFLKPLLSLLPFAIVTFHILASPRTIPADEPSSTIPVTTTAAMPVSRALAQAPPPKRWPIDPLLLSWALGTTGIALYGLRGWRRAIRTARNAESVTDFGLLRALADLRDRAGISRPVRLLHSSEIESAMLVGGRWPSIVLPQSAVAGASLADLRLMLAHEVAHIARRDLAWFGVIWIVQSLFFFNPLVWLAARGARLDHESATDRYAAQLAGVPVQTYAEMLVRATVVARPSLVPGAVPMAESYRTIHRRLEAMKHFNSQPSLWRKSVIGALALGTVGLMPIYRLAEAAPPQAPAVKTVKAKKKPVIPAKPIVIRQIGKGKKASPTEYYVTIEGNTWLLSKKTKSGELVPVKRIPITKARGAKKPKPPKVTRTPKGAGQAFGAGTATPKGAGTQAQGTFVGGGFGTGEAAGQQAPTVTGGFGQGTGSGSARGQGGGYGGTGQGGVAQGGSGQGGTIGGGFSGGSGAGGTQVQGQGAFGGSGFGTGGGQAGAQGGGGVTPSGGFSGQGTHGRVTKRINPTTGTSSFASISSRNAAGTLDFKFNQYNVRLALQMLFRQAGKECVIEPSLNGTITAVAWNVNFEEALQTLLRSAKGGFRIENGTYVLFGNAPSE